jgi:glycosyltransferase involved in cell wall biosynthesis
MALRRLLATTRPDVVQTWMYHADLVGGLVARWAGMRSVVWGIRNSNFDSNGSSFSARVAVRICALLSTWIPAAITCCSQHAAHVHKSLGYCAEKFAVIPNGYDLSHFVPHPEAGKHVRLGWGVPPEAVLVGMVARWDPQKDHGNLLNALARLKDSGAMFYCVLAGVGMSEDNLPLTNLIDRFGLRDVIILAGPRDDIADVMNALDLHVLSSAYGEAFPNVVAEAMACGKPCVVTDVGDAAMIVGNTGWVVPPNDAMALAQAIQQALAAVGVQGSANRGANCRKRIEENFALEKMVETFRGVWQMAASKKTRK